MAWVNFDDVLGQLQAFGLDIEAGDVVTGERRRCRVRDGGREKRGWFQLYELPKADGSGILIVGSFGAFWGTDNVVQKVEIKKDERQAMSAEQMAALKARIAEDKKRAEAETKRRNAKAANAAKLAWTKCLPEGESEYLKRKKVAAHDVRFSPHGNLVIAMRDAQQNIHGLQVIYSVKKNGRDKDFWPAGLAKKGHFHAIGGAPDSVQFIAEGYATAASIYQAIKKPVAVAFDAGNLMPVALALHKQYPQVKIVICADDDYLTEGNPGVKHAEAAALAVGGTVCVPVFPNERPVDRKGDTDFNDLMLAEGLGVVTAQLQAHLAGNRIEDRRDAASGGAPAWGSGGDNDPRPSAAAIMDVNSLVERFIPIDDGTGKVVFDRWTNKLVQREQMITLLPAGARGDDIKRHPVWATRGAYYLDEIGFDPAGTDKDVRLNTWQGWPSKPVPGDCSLMCELIYHQCSKESDIASKLYEWMLQWMAYPLQNPGAKMGSAIVMHGPQGTGKSMIFTTLAELYGYGRSRRNYAIVIDGQALHANFNLDWENKLFINAEEVVNAHDKWELKNQLKHLVTGQTIRVEGKHINAVHNTNRVNISFLSNDLLPFPIEPDDRRHLVIYTPPPKEKQFYRDLREQLQNGGREAFHHFLLNDVDCTHFDHTNPIMTEAKRMLIRLSSSSEHRFLGDWASGELELPIGPARADDVYFAYRRWCANNGERMPRPSKDFHATVHHMANGWLKKKARIYETPTSTSSTPRPIIIPPLEAMQRAGNAAPESGEINWISKCVWEFSKMVTGSAESRDGWAA